MVSNRAKRPKYMKFPTLTYSLTISYFLRHVNLLKYKNKSEDEEISEEISLIMLMYFLMIKNMLSCYN